MRLDFRIPADDATLLGADLAIILLSTVPARSAFPGVPMQNLAVASAFATPMALVASAAMPYPTRLVVTAPNGFNSTTSPTHGRIVRVKFVRRWRLDVYGTRSLDRCGGRATWFLR